MKGESFRELVEKYTILHPLMSPKDLSDLILKQTGIKHSRPDLSYYRAQYLRSLGPVELYHGGKRGGKYFISKVLKSSPSPNGKHPGVPEPVQAVLTDLLETIELLQTVTKRLGGKEATIKLITLLQL